MRLRLACLVAATLAGCAGPPLTPQQRADALHDGGNAPSPNGPRGIVASAPPADLSATPLRCKNYGSEVDCSRAAN
jgi:hypothetical protein